MSDVGATVGALWEPKRPNRLARTMNRLSSPRSMPNAVARFHRRLYERSGGRLGHGLIGAPALLLQTTGRRSGRPRSAVIVYTYDHGKFVIGATNGGDRGNPGWFHNLVADPRLEVQVGRRRVAGTATVLDETDRDYGRLWARLDQSTNGRFSAYREMTARPIPLVAITPASGRG